MDRRAIRFSSEREPAVVRTHTLPLYSPCGNRAASLLADLDRRTRGNEVEKLDDVAITHANAADRAGLSELRELVRAVDIDVAAHRIHCAPAVLSRLASAEPENPRQDPVPPGEARVQLRR